MLSSSPSGSSSFPSPNAVLTPEPFPHSRRDDPLGFVWDLKANPCFRSSLMCQTAHDSRRGAAVQWG